LLANIPAIYLAAIAILIGFVGLIWSADRFVAGAAAFALNFGVAPIVIGLTIVSLGTSAPEILVSLNATLVGSGEIAIGNALGSNIANIGLVLAITALVANIPVQKHILKDEMPVLLFVTAISGVFLFDGTLGAWEGWLLLLLLPPLMFYMVRAKQRDMSAEEQTQEQEEVVPMPMKLACFWFLLGLGILILSSKILVWGAQTTAEFFEVSPLIIGLTVLAIGTSLPELAASVASALKGHHDIALGNIIGSNIFNLLAVMSLPGIIAPLTIGAEVFQRDYLAVAGLTAAVFVFAAFALMNSSNKSSNDSSIRGAYIGKVCGGILLASYLAYIYVLYLNAQT